MAAALYFELGGYDGETQDQRPSMVVFQLVRFAASGMVGVLLIAARKLIARSLFRESHEYSFDEGRLVSVGVAIIAIYFVVSGLVVLGDYFAEYSRGFGEPFLVLRGSVTVGLGLLLLVGAPWVARLWGMLMKKSRQDA